MPIGVLVGDVEGRGVAPAADWARWERQGRVPPSGRGFGLAEAPGEWFAAFAAELGATEVVLTLEWARLQPTPGRYDPEAVEELAAWLALARDRGLSPWGCLVDQTLPGWFADDLGGFLDDANRRLRWPRHVDWLGETFGDLVDGWVTQREPVRRALRGWEWGTAPPGKRDPRRAAEAVQAAVLADGEAWRLLGGGGRPVACLHTTRRVVAADGTGEAQAAARRLDELWWRSWTSALVDGDVAVPGLAPVAADHLRGAFDLVAVALRAPIAVDATGTPRPRPPGLHRGPGGGVAGPEDLALALRRAGEESAPPAWAVAVSAGAAPAEGRHQADHLAAVADEVLAARSDGMAITRWWQAEPVDGYGWERGSVAAGVLDAEGRPKPAAEGLARLR
jgi:beta-glucosidase